MKHLSNLKRFKFPTSNQEQGETPQQETQSPQTASGSRTQSLTEVLYRSKLRTSSRPEESQGTKPVISGPSPLKPHRTTADSTSGHQTGTGRPRPSTSKGKEPARALIVRLSGKG